jgi:hypothetical protein
MQSAIRALPSAGGHDDMSQPGFWNPNSAIVFVGRAKREESPWLKDITLMKARRAATDRS